MSPAMAEQDGDTPAPSMAGGLFLGVANPKAWVAIAAVFASAQLADSPQADAALKLVVLTGMIAMIHVAWLMAGASIAPLLRNPRRARTINAGMAVALLAATMLAFLT
ncbi:hypothetical protein [Nitriliruptor alkaliphilus]|uniref:hypothetical protein n=1 Tax=Nitriliruptor alkaliphilus TaxID=427918 RepID=UPI0012ED79F8|nr:hypothetical protein [Nitriliruptor alkaliphilus]